jgi:hypothetical protein
MEKHVQRCAKCLHKLIWDGWARAYFHEATHSTTVIHNLPDNVSVYNVSPSSASLWDKEVCWIPSGKDDVYAAVY